MEKPEVSEETRFCWDCPSCGNLAEECDDPRETDFYYCEECGWEWKE
jgi:predicted RNA-binding Zn-ribbon protein involved in translation (DUF1610 family)